MKKKIRCSFIICCIAAMVAVGIFAGSGTSLAAPSGKSAAWSASAGQKIAENQTQDAVSADDGELVIVEVQDTETPAANVQVEQEQPSYLLPIACLAAAVAVLVVLLILLRVKYGRLKQQVRRLEDEIAQLYAKNM